MCLQRVLGPDLELRRALHLGGDIDGRLGLGERQRCRHGVGPSGRCQCDGDRDIEPLGLCERHRIDERRGSAGTRSAGARSAARTVRDANPDPYPDAYHDAVRE